MRTFTSLRPAGILLATLLVALLPPSPAVAQDPPPTQPPPTQPPPPASEPSPASPPSALPRVVSVVAQTEGRPDQAGLGDRITVTVENLPRLIEEAGGCGSIVLFLGGLALDGLSPERCDPDDGHVGFRLVRTESSDSAWNALLGSPSRFTRPVMVTVGDSGNRSLPTAVRDFQLVLLPRLGFYLFVAFLVVILTLFFRLATSSELLRDPLANPPPGQRRPYSLARTQLAFWSLLALTAYLFLWTVTGELDTLTDSVLALLGIGSGTALGSALIDSGKRQGASEEKGRLVGEKQTLKTAVEHLEPQLASAAASAAPSASADPTVLVNELAAKKGKLAESEARLAALPAPVRQATTGSFLGDLLGDARGISIHRFQMFLWTIILGLIFCASVYRLLAMPDFSATLLGLLGISNGTYLGFKFPESSAG